MSFAETIVYMIYLAVCAVFGGGNRIFGMMII